MATRAPESPTTPELHAMHSLSDQQLRAITGRREYVNEILDDPSGLLVIAGPCALTNNPETLDKEAAQLAAVQALIRLCGYKPRSEASSWHGMETTPEEVVAAHRITTDIAGRHANVAMEFGYLEHAQRYGRAATLAWLGARNAGNLDLLVALANMRDLPLAIKNGEDGEIAPSLARVDMVNSIRDGVGAAAILLYRGGINALNPDDWERQYLTAYELTGGKLAVDTAHWSMRAHVKGNGKSTDGSRRAADHVLSLSQAGFAPAALMMEASSTPDVVDPNMELQIALDTAASLRQIKADLYASVR